MGDGAQKMTRTKERPISFRPTLKVIEELNRLLDENPKSDRTSIINETLERGFSEKNSGDRRVFVFCPMYSPDDSLYNLTEFDFCIGRCRDEDRENCSLFRRVCDALKIPH